MKLDPVVLENTYGLTMAELLDTLKQSAPTGMKVKANLVDGTFVMEDVFNPGELKSHTQALTGETADIDFSKTGPPFSTTFHFVDKTPAENYFNWVWDALTKRGKMNEEQAKSLKGNFLAKASVTMPDGKKLDEYKNNMVETRIDLPVNQEMTINWNVLMNSGTVDLAIQVVTEGGALDGKEVSKFLTESWNSNWKEENLDSGGAKYTTEVKINGNSLKSLPMIAKPLEKAIVDWTHVESHQWNKQSYHLGLEIEPTGWLGTSNVNAQTEIKFYPLADVVLPTSNLGQSAPNDGLSFSLDSR